MRLIDADALTEFFKARMALWLNVDEVLDVISDAPTEVETIEPVKIDAFGIHTWACGCCLNIVGTKLFRSLYCSHCGRKVKWDETD